MHLFYLKALSNTQPLLPCTPPKPFIRTNKITKPLVINHAPLKPPFMSQASCTRKSRAKTRRWDGSFKIYFTIL